MQFKKYLKRKALHETFMLKLRDKFTIGTDGITASKFETIIDDEIDIIKRKVANLSYNVSVYSEKLILKNRNSKPRMISIPTHRDKLTFTALNSYISYSFQKILPKNSSIHEKILDIKNTIKSNKFDSFIKLDVENFYPSIDHEILLKKVSKVISDETALSLLQKAITKDTVGKGRKSLKVSEELTKGIPQGLSFSNILSDIYFASFDKKYLKKVNIAYYRFVDDILILCQKDDIKNITNSLIKDMKKLKLTSHIFEKNSEKSSTGTIATDPFKYLGYKFSNDIISVREASVDKLKDNIIKLFSIYKDDEYQLYKKLNLKITGCIFDGKRYGWMSFFALSNDLTLIYHLDSFVKNCFKKFKIEYKEKKIKEFTKTYYALKDIENSTYIPKYQKKDKIEIYWLQEDVDFY